jgi:glucokinase
VTRRLGIDVGGSSIKWVVLEGDTVVDEGSVATPQEDAGAVLHAVSGLVPDGIEAVGLALPSVIEGTTTLLAPNLPGDWNGLDVAARLAFPVTICNDARAFTLAEWRLGAARGCDDVLAITLGTGVGGGVVSDGRLVEGHRGTAGEFGHLPIERGARCGCGADGCLEAVAGARGLVRASGLESAEAVVDAARAGDPAATAALARAGDAIGRALAVVATALGPELVVVGGGLAGALDLLRGPIEARLREREHVFGPCPVVPAELGLRAGAIGAALWGTR